MRKCSICDNIAAELVDVSRPSGREIKAWFCQKHLSLINRNHQPIARCCGRLVDKNGRCTVCGDQY